MYCARKAAHDSPGDPETRLTWSVHAKKTRAQIDVADVKGQSKGSDRT